MLHGITRAACAALGLVLAGAVHAGDCFNDDNETRNDFEPAVLTVSEADLAKMLADIAASEARRQAAKKAREPAQAAAPAAPPAGGG